MAHGRLPIETRLRVFCLYMAGMTPSSIIRLMRDYGVPEKDIPSNSSIGNWARVGMFTDEIPWDKLQPVVSVVFDQMNRKKYTQTVGRDYATWATESRADLDKMQQLIVGQLDSMDFKPGDLPKIIEARNKIENSTIERIQQLMAYVKTLGNIINGVAEITQGKFKSTEVDYALRFLMDRIIIEFEEFVRIGTHEPRRILEGNYGLRGTTGFITEARTHGEGEASEEGPV